MHRRFRLPFVVSIELSCVALAFVLAFLLRFEFEVPREKWVLMLNQVGPLILCRALAYWYWKLHSRARRFFSSTDFTALIKANAAGTALFVITLFLWMGHGLGGMPRSVLFIEFLLTTALWAGIRFMVRMYYEHKIVAKEKERLENALIIGAGDAGIRLAREIMMNPLLGLRLEGFLDDAYTNRRVYLMGRPVLGSTQDLPEVAQAYSISEVIIAIPNAPPRTIRRIKNISNTLHLRCRILPPLEGTLVDQPLWAQVYDLDLKDLLGREITSFSGGDEMGRNRPREDEVILVSGAAGSIGSEICRQLASSKPRRLLLLDQSESGIYDLKQELARRDPDLDALPIIGDIADRAKVEWVCATHRPSLIYHAAAYKHVPLMEDEPVEAVRTNILGSVALGMAANQYGAARLVYISTDKAVSPVSIMGMTKLAAEQILTSLNRGLCRFSAVRFGNVIYSNGSVIPLFRRQVEEGGPVTITDPEVSRFFMTIEEAVNLVLASGDMGEEGDIFLLDMGAPVKILDVAHQVIRQAGLEPEKDIEIKVIGLRPGEKLHEDLYWLGEGIRDTAHPKIKSARAGMMNPEQIETWVERFRQACLDPSGKQAREALKDYSRGGGAHSDPAAPACQSLASSA